MSSLLIYYAVLYNIIQHGENIFNVNNNNNNNDYDDDDALNTYFFNGYIGIGNI